MLKGVFSTSVPQHEKALTTPIVAVGGLLVENRKLLLVRRGNPPSRGLWTLPGGRVKLGETLHDALVREFEEETGIRVQPVGLADAVDIIERAADGRIRYHYVVIDYWVERLTGSAQAASDALEVGWYPIDALPRHDMPPLSHNAITRMLRARGFEEAG